MRLVTFEHDGTRAAGALAGGRVIPISAAYAALRASRPPSAEQPDCLPDDVIGLLALGEAGMEATRRVVEFAATAGDRAEGLGGRPLSLPLESVRLLAPIPRPGKIICVGLNYRDHAEELSMAIPPRPLIFAKYANTVVGPGEAVTLPAISDCVDFEVELAVVIGRVAKNVAEAEAPDCVAGYTILNDVSARDLQLKLGGGQWVWGKTLDTFAPIGPALVTKDEVPDPGELDIAFRLNGRTMQRSNTRNLIFGVPQLVSFLSQGMTLEPGDIIATGTPAGVGHNRKPPVYLRPGDVMAAEVQRLGVLENPVVADW